MAHTHSHFFDIFLFWSHPATVFAICLVGFFCHDRKLWGVAGYLTLFSIILNAALKEYFHMPRPGLMGSGFSFPSGHFSGSFAFYGWIALMWRNTIVRLAAALILLSIGFGLVYRGFHFVRDIFGAIAEGTIVILLTARALSVQPFKSDPPKLGPLFIALSSIPFLYLYLTVGIPRRAWASLGILILTTLIWMVALPYYDKWKKGHES